MGGSNDVERVDVREAAMLTGRSAETVRRWVWGDRVAAVKRGNRLLLDKAQVLQMINTAPTKAPPTLREWAADVGRRHAGVRGGTAADLVLQDRAAREDVHAGG